MCSINQGADAHIYSIRCVYIDHLVRWTNSGSHEPDLVHARQVQCLLACDGQPHSCPTPSIMLLARQRSKLVTRFVTARDMQWIVVRLSSCRFFDLRLSRYCYRRGVSMH